MNSFPILGESHADKILNALYAGETVKTEFSTALERASFRKRLYARKAQQDYLLSTILDEDRRILRMSMSHDMNGFYAIYWLEEMKKIDFVILPQ